MHIQKPLQAHGEAAPNTQTICRVSLPHWPSVLLANMLKGTSTEKMRPENMTWTPISWMVTYILIPTRETIMPFCWKPGLTTLLLKMIWIQIVEGSLELGSST